MNHTFAHKTLLCYDQNLVKSEVTGQGDQQTDQTKSHVAVKSVAPSGPRPATAFERSLPLQDLSPSEEWRFSLEEELLVSRIRQQKKLIL